MSDKQTSSALKSTGDIELIDVILKIWNERKLIMIITTVFTIIGLLYALLSTPLYESHLTLYPATGQEEDINAGIKQFAAQFGIGGLNSTNNYNIPDVVKSRKIEKKVINKKWKTEEYKNRLVNLIEFWGISENATRESQEKAIKRLDELLSVSTYDETGLITISILTEEPQLSADIVNYIGNEVQNYIRFEQKKQGKSNRVFIENRLMAAKAELTTAEEALKQFKEENRIVTNSPEINLQYNRLRREIEVKQEIYITLQKQKELALIDEEKNTPIVNILDVGEKAVRKSKPKRLLIVVSSFFLGLLIGILSVFLKTIFKPVFIAVKKEIK